MSMNHRPNQLSQWEVKKIEEMKEDYTTDSAVNTIYYSRQAKNDPESDPIHLRSCTPSPGPQYMGLGLSPPWLQRERALPNKAMCLGITPWRQQARGQLLRAAEAQLSSGKAIRAQPPT